MAAHSTNILGPLLVSGLIAIAVAVAIVLVLALLSNFLRPSSRMLATKVKPTYEAVPGLLSAAERSFFGVLRQALSNDYQIFAKVRLADIVRPVPGPSRSGWQAAFNRITGKHVDFVICDSASLMVRAVIELDDRTHQRFERSNRDSIVDAALSDAQIPVVRIQARASYAPGQLRDQIESCLVGRKAESSIATLTARGKQIGFLVISVVALNLLGVGCASTSNEAKLPTCDKMFNASKDSIWPLVVREVARNYPLKSIDKENGLLATDAVSLPVGNWNINKAIRQWVRAPGPNLLVGYSGLRVAVSGQVIELAKDRTQVIIHARYEGLAGPLGSSNVSWVSCESNGRLENDLLTKISSEIAGN